MKKDVRKIILTNPVWEYKKVVEVCNEQSKQGYQLEKLRIFGPSKFIKNEDKKYIYDVDFNTIILKKGKEREDYLEAFEEQGWEFIDNTFNGFSIFRKLLVEGQPMEDYKIYTDKDTEKEVNYRMSKFLKTLLLVVILIAALPTGCVLTIRTISCEITVAEAVLIFVSSMMISFLPFTIFACYGIRKLKYK